MKDPRFVRLASLLVKHSCDLKPGEKVLIESFDVPADFTSALVSEVASAGGLPMVSLYDQTITRSLLNVATEDQMAFLGHIERQRMEGMAAYIGVRGNHNIAEMSDVPRERMERYERHYWTPVHRDVRIPKTKWVILRWPTPSMAQAANMSTEAFEDFFFRVCAGVDYAAMRQAMLPLQELMANTDQVHITGPGTDLRFSIKNIGTHGCWGQRNIPDGECFSCPVRDSANGTIQFNCETFYRGIVFNGIRLVLNHGKVVEATCTTGGNDKLNEILDSDEGARYIGEWSLGFNPHVLHPMKDTLFDEKIAGSFHFTPGNAYEDVGNGNKSQVHWDMVCIQRPEHGGGSVAFDGKTIRKDGLFVLPELAGLNPDRLGV